MIKIETHVRGIAIYIPEGTKRSEVGKRLRSRLPRDLILSYQGQFIVPLESAHLVALEFASHEAIYSADVQKIVEAQRQTLARTDAARLEVAEALASPQQILDGYNLIDQLDAHQVEAVAAMTVPSLVGLALFDEQGLGKTVMGLCAFDRLRETRNIDYLLVLAPKSVLASWISDIVKLFHDKYKVKIAAGSQDTRRRRIRSHFDILLCSYETVVSELFLLKRIIGEQNARFMLVVDESYFVKNPDAKRSQAVAELRLYCDRAIILCGTPAPNAPKDLIHQLQITSAGMSGANMPIPKDDEEITAFVTQALENTIYLRRLKSNVLPNIPEKQIEKVFVELSPAQRALYQRARQDLVLTVRSIDDRQFQKNLRTFLARRTALMQICSHPGAIDPLYNETPAKLLALDKLLYDLVLLQKKKAVVWSFFRYSLQAIADRYKNKYNLVRVDGSIISLNERKEAIRNFQEVDDVKIFLGNAAAAGAGITLTAAHHAIYESFSNQAAHYMQSVDRIHRRGQEHSATYHILLTQSTIEEIEFDQILEKERSGRKLLGDHYEEPMTRERFLAELGVSDD